MAQGGVYVQGAASDATITTPGTAGQVLTSNGPATVPTFQAVPSVPADAVALHRLCGGI